ncbi:hypothetical protein SAMD00019534_094240 [Acytostelium subglobosum LB1]|uniref:hypothetical protein n=1 Tax=Acytostelium subglobosum LB1 TaxID=1410327 RepID=UPI00064512AB|nr:hypothetical protein SAMD00019534_094240 [Acytostelium subglobosum LB1]GAM26249.1 hypothetical protein SAMD00019534_094240 [Acytostelium subglobosum LB1]|eukprot:XP_012750803.1 hypothetical protein SAMD00019534_094240 [Acytostelium subglobosum LB1]
MSLKLLACCASLVNETNNVQVSLFTCPINQFGQCMIVITIQLVVLLVNEECEHMYVGDLQWDDVQCCEDTFVTNFVR